jgi:hypothetical protein
VRTIHQSVARMQQATGAAAPIALKLLTDPNVPAAVKLRAAECVEDIEARVAELERAAEVATRRS